MANGGPWGARLSPSAWLAAVAALLLATLAACASAPAPPAAGGEPQLPTTPVILPNGVAIAAELAVTPQQQAQGLMYRTHLAPDRGMLFVGQRAAPRAFWMYRCRIPLDIVWMDGGRRIVEIVRRAPPCRDSDPANCPSYGGNVESVYVLELAAGQAEGLRLGDRLEFRP